jgi:hypothetical protein
MYRYENMTKEEIALYNQFKDTYKKLNGQIRDMEDALYYEIQLNEYLRLSGMQEYNRKELVNHLKDDALKLAVKSYEDENK